MNTEGQNPRHRPVVPLFQGSKYMHKGRHKACKKHARGVRTPLPLSSSPASRQALPAAVEGLPSCQWHQRRGGWEWQVVPVSYTAAAVSYFRAAAAYQSAAGTVSAWRRRYRAYRAAQRGIGISALQLPTSHTQFHKGYRQNQKAGRHMLHRRPITIIGRHQKRTYNEGYFKYTKVTEGTEIVIQLIKEI